MNRNDLRNCLIFILVALTLTLASALCEIGDIRYRPTPIRRTVATVAYPTWDATLRFAPMATLTPRR